MTDVYEWLLTHSDQANALSAMASASIAFLALLVATISLYLTVKTIKLQKIHNIISVRPIPGIQWDMEGSVAKIILFNNGYGTLIIKRFSVFYEDKEFSDFQSAFANLNLNRFHKKFSFELSGRSVRASQSQILLSMQSIDNNERFSTIDFMEIVSIFEQISVVIEYTDFYDTDYQIYTKNLTSIKRLAAGTASEVAQ